MPLHDGSPDNPIGVQNRISSASMEGGILIGHVRLPLALVLAFLSAAEGSTQAAIERGHAPVNGIRMYYEVHGPSGGVPLILIHGGGSTIESTFGRILPLLAESRRVIALEEQAHGRTSDRDAPVRFESSADDVAALLRFLKVGRADLFGFSNGASVALQVAIRHPELVRKLVFASSMTRRDGAQPEFWEFMKQADFSNMPQPLKEAFLRVNPDERLLRRMHDKDAERMRSFEDVPDDRVRAVRAPTLIVLGDREVVRPEHAVELTHLFPDARLLILPGGHGDYLGEIMTMPQSAPQAALTAGFIEAFLVSPSESGTVER
jgi:pimeloyl-ACP methyl ester carboxylesterase